MPERKGSEAPATTAATEGKLENSASGFPLSAVTFSIAIQSAALGTYLEIKRSQYPHDQAKISRSQDLSRAANELLNLSINPSNAENSIVSSLQIVGEDSNVGDELSGTLESISNRTEPLSQADVDNLHTLSTQIADESNILRHEGYSNPYDGPEGAVWVLGVVIPLVVWGWVKVMDLYSDKNDYPKRIS